MAKKKRDHDKKSDQRDSGGDDRIKDIWHRDAGTALVGLRDFKVTLRRGQKRGNLRLDPMATSLDWEDSGPTLTGDMELTAPKGKKIPDIQQGDLVVCEASGAVKHDAGWKEVWQMRVDSVSFEAMEGDFSLTLADEMKRFAASKDDWKFTKDHRHPKGWTATEITKEVCKRYGVQVRALKKSEVRIKKLVKKDTSPLDIIQQAYARDKRKTGERTIIRFRGGKLEVLPLRYSKFLYVFAGTITGATLVARDRKGFATVLNTRITTDDKGSKRNKKKTTLRVKSSKLLRRFGLLVAPFETDADSAQEARRDAKRKLVKTARVKRDVSITHPGMPNVWRGDAVKIKLPDEGFSSEVLFIKQASHSVSPGTYDMELTLSWDDPVADARKERECQKRCEQARKNNRKPPDECNCPKVKKRDKDKKSDQRADAGDDSNTRRQGGVS